MATVSYYLSARKDARGKSEIYLRFVAGRDHTYRLHTSLYIDPSRWKDGGVALPRLETSERQELLKIRLQLEELTNHMLTEFAAADKTVVDRRWMQRTVDAHFHPGSANGLPSALHEAFSIFMEHAKKKVSQYRMRRYKVVCEALERWAKARKAVPHVNSVDRTDLAELEAFITNEARFVTKKNGTRNKGTVNKKRSGNTVIQYMEVLRAFYHWAFREGYTTNRPFDTYQLAAARYGTPYYLTTEELEQLYRADLGRRPALAVQRDIFVFQCQVGCRVGDLLRFDQSDIVDGALEYIPGKTRGENPRTVRVPLNGTAREILARYEDDAYPRLLPFISSQKYNDAIKDAFRLAGLTRPVTVLDPLTRQEVKKPLNEVASSHLARRTFIGNLYKQVKDPNLISSMSGHVEGSRAFARYRSIDDDIKTELVGILEGKVK